MKFRKFGALEFDAHPIAFGGASVSGEGGGYGFGDISEADAVKLLQASLDAGINVFDTAPVYGYGESERRFGKAFADRRDKAFIVSKCGVDWGADKKFRVDNSPETTRRMLDQSLKDLKTDYVDLYFIHWPDKDVDVRETMRVISEAKKAGKVRAIGLSNFLDPADISKAAEVDQVDVLQAEFNLFNDEPARKTFPFALEEKIGFMAYGTFDKGVLTGRVTRDREFDKSDFRNRFKVKKKSKFDAMDRINALLAEAGSDGRQLALAYVLGHEAVSVALCGIRGVEQLKTALAAVENPPPTDLVAEARKIAAEAF